MALAFVLVFGAAVLGRSALRLARVDLGFDPSHALSLAVPTEDDRFETDEAEWAFHRELRSRLRALPGVVDAGAVSHLPLAGYAPTDAFSPPAADTLTWGSSLANYFAATPGYLEAIGVELQQGRSLEDLDMEMARPVAVVDETLAAEHFPGVSPVGRTIKAGWGLPDLEIVGVIRHPRVMDVRASVRPQIYVPYAVFGWGPLHYVVRSAGDPNLLAASVRGEVDALGAGRAVFNVRPLDSYLRAATSSMRMTVTLIMVQAALTAFLAALGLFTVIAYIAHQTRRETAIRSALGATPNELLELHLRGGATILLGALPVGLALALAGSRLLGSMVYGVSASDAWSLAAAAGVTAAAGMLATYLPARRAAKANPLEALRS
jgi:predicted permease